MHVRVPRLAATVFALAALTLTACIGQSDGPDGGEPSSGEPSSGEPSSAEPTQSAELPPTPATTYPGKSWKRAEMGDWRALDATLARDGSTCVAVIKDGVLVHDAYWNGGAPNRPQRVYSITKSLTSLLVGMQADGGAIDLDASMPQGAVRSLLSMTSGRYWSEGADRQMIRAEPDQSAFAARAAQAHEPGTAWTYDNVATQALEPIVAAGVKGGDVASFAREKLLDPLGMQNTIWGRDATGHALTYSGVESTCQDLARVGHLMLNDGTWKRQRIVSADYVQQATKPSSTLNAAYGLLWWTNAEGRIVEVLRQAGFTADKAPYEGRLARNVPADAYWAFGYGNQYLAVVPSQGVVAVRLGARPASPDHVTFDSFTSSVLRAIPHS